MTQSTIPGFPRIGPNRELKKSVEAYWQGKINRDQVKAACTGQPPLDLIPILADPPG